MAAALISGCEGSVTYASGYTTNAYSWLMRYRADVIDRTPFTPTSSYMSRQAGILSGSGTYKCHYPVTVTSAVTGPAYVSFVNAYDLTLICKELEGTKFTDAAKTYIAGLLSAEGNYTAWLDDTTALPTAGATANGVFLLQTGLGYTVPLVVGEDVSVEVSADGSARQATIPFKSTGVVTLTGSPPIPGIASSAATFVAYTGRQYSGSIIPTRIGVRMRADRTQGEITVDFVVNGALTPA